MSLGLYGVFLAIQTASHRQYFLGPGERAQEAHASLATMSATERRDLAVALKALLVRYDNLWQMSFPYVMTLHQAPTDGGRYPSVHFHIEFHPPLRTPTLLKGLPTQFFVTVRSIGTG